MKQLIIALIVFSAVFSFSKARAQEDKSRKEIREERQEQRRETIRNLLKDTTFVFYPTHAMPMGGGSINLNHSFDAQVKGDTLASYLPFYGVAYHLDYGGRDAGFDFIQPINEYKMEKDGNGYLVRLEVKNGIDLLNYTFRISPLGYTTLNVISTKRQAISFYGSVEAIEQE